MRRKNETRNKKEALQPAVERMSIFLTNHNVKMPFQWTKNHSFSLLHLPSAIVASFAYYLTTIFNDYYLFLLTCVGFCRAKLSN